MFYIREIKRIFALSLDVRTKNVIPRDITVSISAFIALHVMHDVEGSWCIKNLVFLSIPLSFLIGCLKYNIAAYPAHEGRDLRPFGFILENERKNEIPV